MAQETVKIKNTFFYLVVLPLGKFQGPDMQRGAGGGLAGSRGPSIMSMSHL